MADRPREPMDEHKLTHPTPAEALTTAGALCHYVASSPKRLADFARWAEHCPGDLDPDLVRRVMAATHDVLQPACPEPIDTHPGRSHG